MPAEFDKNLNQNAESSCNSSIISSCFEEQEGQFRILVLVGKAYNPLECPLIKLSADYCRPAQTSIVTTLCTKMSCFLPSLSSAKIMEGCCLFILTQQFTARFFFFFFFFKSDKFLLQMLQFLSNLKWGSYFFPNSSQYGIQSENILFVI